MNAFAPVVHLVDDDPACLNATARLLGLHGLAVRSFASSAALLGELTPNTRGCVVADLRMPGVSGLDLQEALARLCPTLPVVFLSGRGDIPSTVRAMRGGAEDFLEKRCPETQLVDAVKRALARDAQARADHDRKLALRAAFETLTAREREVLALVVRGLRNKQIAAELAIHERTVKLHRTAITTKLKLRSAVDLARLCQAAGLAELEPAPFPNGQ